MAEDSSGNSSARDIRRLELRRSNLQAWEEDGIDVDALGSLDTSLKRNTAFIKRLRTSLQLSESVQALIKEVNALSLEKYISELVSATSEGLTKCKSAIEINGAVEVVSALHQRFPNVFSIPLVSSLQTSLQPPSKAYLASVTPEQRDKEENARVLRQRGLLRIFAELELVAVVKPDKKSVIGDATFNHFRDLLTADKELLVLSIPLAIAFTKHLGPTFLPPRSASEPEQPTPAEAEAPAPEDDSLISSAQKNKFKKLLSAFYEALSRRAVRDHTQLLETDRRNHDAYIRSGEIFEDRAQTYERMARNWEKIWTGTQSLSEALGLALPTLPPLPTTTIVTGTGSSAFTGQDKEDGIGGAGSIWLDEEDKKFYTDLLDLKGEVPGSLLTSGAAEAREEAARHKETLPSDERMETSEDMDTPDTATGANETEEALAPAPAAQLSALFARLPDMSSLDSIDKASVEFMFLNSKAARKRLVKFVGTVPRSRQDLIPYYARLIATLNQYFPDIGSGVVALLEDEFRYFQRRKGQDLSESRAKNIRFLSELTKFGITPSHSILHVLKVSLDDFSGSSIENICTLLETCGRYLLRSENTREKMAAMLDTLKRKKSVQNLDHRQVTMLDNAYYQCDPPDRPVVVPKERTPMQLYIRHLLYDTLAKSTVDNVVKSLRKLHWEDPQVVGKLYNAFTKVWKVKFSNIYLFAILLHDLARYHSDFCVNVVDGVLENITAGMEHNIFKYNQQRVATVKYLGELYTYRMVDARVVLETLWALLTFGHPEGRPLPGRNTSMDAQDDFFRIRLVCTLLDTCGMYFDKGPLRKRMDNFLIFFQMYIKTKLPLPMDVDFMVSDTFETLRPKQTLFATFEEAAVAVDEMLARSTQNLESDIAQEAELQLSDDEDGDRKRYLETEGLSDDEKELIGDDASSDDESDDSDSDSSSSGTSSEDEGDTRGITTEEQDDFERELARMMSEAGSERKSAPSTAKSALADVNLPMFSRQHGVAANGSHEESANNHMKFMLLTKKGSKQQTRSVEVPLESSLAVHTLTKQQESKAEQQQLKRLVLQYEQREEEESRRSFVDSAAKKGYRIRFD